MKFILAALHEEKLNTKARKNNVYKNSPHTCSDINKYQTERQSSWYDCCLMATPT